MPAVKQAERDDAMRLTASLLVAAMLGLSAPALAEQAVAPGKRVVALANISCADLRAEVRLNLPECAPKRVVAKVRPAPLRATLVADGGQSRRKITKMPWMVGVFQ
jgi:hypothetical protein